VAGSDPEAKEAIEKEVYAAIQQVRDDTNAQLAQLSWRQLLRQKRLEPKTMNVWQKLWWWCLELFGLICLLMSMALGTC